MDARVREQRHTTTLALALSAGLHLLVLLTLEPAPGSWRHGLTPALRVALQPPPDAQGPVSATPRPAPVPRAGTPAETPPRTDDPGSAAPSPQAGASMPLTDRYFTRREVDIAAEALVRGPLVFPENALIWKLSGTVRARVYISETGTVDSVQIVEATPRGHFEQAALDALRQVRYRPAEIRGRAVKSQKLIEVTFDPYEGSAQAPRRPAH